jgi:lipoprotein-anchoring transpeptidase ErfK/SrfK
LLVIGAVLASAAQAYQPLTRSGCEDATLVWDESANVCTGSVAAAEAASAPEITQAVGQPLTKTDCDGAGLRWNDGAHVCEAGPPTEATTAGIAAPVIRINIDKAKQRMTVFVDGIERYNWPVSTGLRGYSTPSGTYTTSSMNKMWYSKQWDNAPMPHAVFFTKEGHAIHGTYEVKRLGKPASHGCVRLSTEHAATLYALVDEIGLKNTQVVLAGLTPGGESRDGPQVSSKRRQFQEAEADGGPKRGGFFRRLFGRR